MTEVSFSPATDRESIDDVLPLLVAATVSKAYRIGNAHVVALHEVDLTVSAGDFVAIVGLRGSGKSTLLACLSGAEPADSGRVVIDGEEVTAGPGGDSEQQRPRMGFVGRTDDLDPQLTAVENVMLPLQPANGSTAEIEATALELLDRVGLAARAGYLPRALSRSERQRVAIARALVGRPPILWVDEPTGDLDPAAAGRVMETLRRINAEHGQTIVLATRELAVGLAAGRLVYLRDGRLEPEKTWISGRVGLPAPAQPWWSPPTMG